MLKKAYKTITLENGEIKIYGNGHDIEIEYKIPEWNEDKEDADLEGCFQYKGNTYFLSEFTNIHNTIYSPNPPEWQLEFDGIKSDSYFSGILIKLSDDGEGVKAYTFIC